MTLPVESFASNLWKTSGVVRTFWLPYIWDICDWLTTPLGWFRSQRIAFFTSIWEVMTTHDLHSDANLILRRQEIWHSNWSVAHEVPQRQILSKRWATSVKVIVSSVQCPKYRVNNPAFHDCLNTSDVQDSRVWLIQLFQQCHDWLTALTESHAISSPYWELNSFYKCIYRKHCALLSKIQEFGLSHHTFAPISRVPQTHGSDCSQNGDSSPPTRQESRHISAIQQDKSITFWISD
jgi:hypothetical protein